MNWRDQVYWRRRHVLEWTGWERRFLSRLVAQGVIEEVRLPGDRYARFASGQIKSVKTAFEREAS